MKAKPVKCLYYPRSDQRYTGKDTDLFQSRTTGGSEYSFCFDHFWYMSCSARHGLCSSRQPQSWQFIATLFKSRLYDYLGVCWFWKVVTVKILQDKNVLCQIGSSLTSQGMTSECHKIVHSRHRLKRDWYTTVHYFFGINYAVCAMFVSNDITLGSRRIGGRV